MNTRLGLPPHDWAEAARRYSTSRPVVFPEVPISRQYNLHVLMLPGDLQPTWHRWLFQVIHHAEQRGFHTLTIVIEGEQHELSRTT